MYIYLYIYTYGIYICKLARKAAFMIIYGSFSNWKQPPVSISLDMCAEPSIDGHVYQLIVREVLPKKSAVAPTFFENSTDLTYIYIYIHN